MEKVNVIINQNARASILTKEKRKTNATLSTKVKLGGAKIDSMKPMTQVKPVEKPVAAKVDTVGPNRFQVLSFEQVKRLHVIIDKILLIKPNVMSSLPVIKTTLRELLGEIRKKLKSLDIIVNDIRLNMDVASNVVGSEFKPDFKMVDVIFTFSLNDRSVQNKIKDTVLKILLQMLQSTIDGRFITINECDINEQLIKDNYIRKMARANNLHDSSADVWSIISIGMQDSDGQTVEMKFIEKMKRQYEFTIDSFQIILDTMLAFYTVSKCSTITSSLFPTVVAESVSGSFHEAMRHLKERVIFTRQPEEIYGGGLLKYCKLLLDGYKLDSSMDVASTERYMCSRFFIDYPERNNQKQKVETYLNTHFYADYEKQSRFVKRFYKIISKSTVCLMIHERRQTLQLINDLLQSILTDIELKRSVIHFDDFSNQNWILDQVFYGTLYFPQQVYVTSPLEPKESGNLNLNNIIGDQILICTGDNTHDVPNHGGYTLEDTSDELVGDDQPLPMCSAHLSCAS